MVFYSMFYSSVSASTCLSCCMKRKIFSWRTDRLDHDSIATCPFIWYLWIDCFSFWNGVTVLRRESHSLANLLTLILAIFLTLFLVFDFFLLKYLPQWINALFFCVPLILIYLFIVFYNFLTVSFLYQFNRPRYNQDFIVVLGAGLINGETVSPLLAKRINKAIAFYRAQSRATLNPPILLMSGGQGADEKYQRPLR